MNADDERIFEALPPTRGHGFAQSWWGRAWLKALEDTALDGQQLKKGRAYARQGAVGAVSVRPGRITAVVRDRDGTSYRADVLLREFGPEEWERLLGVVSGEAGHIAALLDRDMPPHLAEDASGAGVELLPGIGDLDPECTCDAWDHCPHTAALSYQLARLLDQDPFVLLLLRGRGERELLDALQVRSAAQAARPAAGGAEARGEPRTGGLPGVAATEAFALGGVLPPLPAPPEPVDTPGGTPALAGAVAAPDGLDVAALELLAADAAARARRLLAEALGQGLGPGNAGSAPPGSLDSRELTAGQDAVRLAAARPGPAIIARLAAGSGRTVAALEQAVRAWEFGGREALTVLEDAWTPGREAAARAADQLAAEWPEEGAPEDAAEEARPRLRVERNRWTAVGANAQLRLGRDGLWWPYRREDGAWWPAGPSGRDPASVLAALLAEE